MKKNILDWIALVIVIISGINFLVMAILELDFIGNIFALIPFLDRLIYTIFGLSILYLVYRIFKD